MTISPYIYPGLKTVTLNQIISNACEILSIDVKTIQSKSRKQETLFKRYMIVGFIRDYYTCKYINSRGEIKSKCEYSFPLIGKHMGGKDHTTILHESRQHINLLEDPTYTEYRDIYMVLYNSLIVKFPKFRTAFDC